MSGVLPSGAHPRSRGENDLPAPMRVPPRGASPLTRGKPQATITRAAPCGRIPAHAGKTHWGSPLLHHQEAHPRSRGENSWDATQQVQGSGASPLTRGKRSRVHRRARDRGRIPAHAGKTRRRPGRPARRRAHPRSRGENTHAFLLALRGAGASPLTRGKPEAPVSSGEAGGRIPAHAGKTPDLRFYRADRSDLGKP